MKTLTTLIIATAASFSLNANAIDVDTLSAGEIFPIQNPAIQEQMKTVSAKTDGLEYDIDSETLVYLNASEKQSVASVLHELESNPPAAGNSKGKKNIFIWNENGGEYHLQ
ncbi:MAG: hypothetical protein KZQ83_19865 [gamma proteobacterium symbiont of Taylorina sp.]|nr:hypothetical protein [gamma proteobacterium symbiont of Taylorina sp.]